MKNRSGATNTCNKITHLHSLSHLFRELTRSETLGGKHDPSFAQVNWSCVKNFLSSSKSPKTPESAEIVRIVFRPPDRHDLRKCSFGEEYDRYASGCSRCLSEECDSREWEKGVREWGSELDSVLVPTSAYAVLTRITAVFRSSWLYSGHRLSGVDNALVIILWAKGGPPASSQVQDFLWCGSRTFPKFIKVYLLCAMIVIITFFFFEGDYILYGTI